MTLWRYALAALVAFTIIAKHALSLGYDGSALDYVYAIPTAVVPLGVAILLALRKRASVRMNNVGAYAMPTVAGLAIIALLSATAR